MALFETDEGLIRLLEAEGFVQYVSEVPEVLPEVTEVAVISTVFGEQTGVGSVTTKFGSGFTTMFIVVPTPHCPASGKKV